MAKSDKKPAAKKAAKVGGPFLAAAVFCESIMEESSKIVSAIKIIDGVQYYIHPDAPDDVPSKEHPVPISQRALLTFKTGDSPGTHHLKMVLEEPSGNRQEIKTQEIVLSPPPQGGCNVTSTIAIPIRANGVYWFDVFLDGKLMTRMPLNVNVQRLPKSS